MERIFKEVIVSPRAKAIPANIEMAPPVSHLVEACSRVYTSGKRITPIAPRIITAHPAKNSTYSITEPTFQILGYH